MNDQERDELMKEYREYDRKSRELKEEYTGSVQVDPPTPEEYNKMKTRIAFDFAPRIYPCKKCGWPVADGYVCDTCGDPNPSEKD